MTTQTDRHHLTWPSTDRLKARLAQAEDERLILFNVSEQHIGATSVEFRSQCTPSESMDAYDQWLRWDMVEGRVYVHCTCTAGYHGVPCKHAALLGDSVAALDEDWMILDADDYLRYDRLALLPDWKEKDDEQ